MEYNISLMIFSKKTIYTSASLQQPQQPQTTYYEQTEQTQRIQALPSMMRFPVNIPQPQKKILAIEPIAFEKDDSKAKWGQPVWLFFHTLSIKVKDDSFDIVKGELLNLIYAICSNLPCPICSDHAKEYLKSVNFSAIQTKTQLIDFFFQFHNMVNKRKHIEPFPRDQVEPKYNLAITQNIFFNFIRAYNEKSYNTRHIYDEHIRQRVLTQLKNWFYKNSSHFDQ
jgi:hypothetical protein